MRKEISILTSISGSVVYISTVLLLLVYQGNLEAEQEFTNVPHDYVGDFTPGSLEYFVNECKGVLDKSIYINETFQIACEAYIEGALMTAYILNNASKGSLNLCVDKDYTRKELREEFLKWINDGKLKGLSKKAPGVLSFVIERFECKSSKHNNSLNSDDAG